MDTVELAEYGQAKECTIPFGIGMDIEVKPAAGWEKTGAGFVPGAQAFFQSGNEVGLPVFHRRFPLPRRPLQGKADGLAPLPLYQEGPCGGSERSHRPAAGSAYKVLNCTPFRHFTAKQGAPLRCLEQERRGGSDTGRRPFGGILYPEADLILPGEGLQLLFQRFRKRLVARLGLDDDLVRSSDAARRRFLLVDGRLQEIPTSPGAFLGSRLLPLGGKLRMARELFVPPRRDLSRAAVDPATDETIAELRSRIRELERAARTGDVAPRAPADVQAAVRALAREMGMAGRAKILEKFNAEQHYEGLMSVYKAVL